MKQTFTTIALLFVAMLASDAAASTIPAVDARVADPNNDDPGCYLWIQNGGGLERTCPGVAFVSVAVPVNDSGTKTLTFSAYRPTNQHQMNCRVIVQNNIGQLTHQGSFKSMTSTGYQAIALTSFTIPTNGSAHAECGMGQGTRLLSFSLTPD